MGSTECAGSMQGFRVLHSLWAGWPLQHAKPTDNRPLIELHVSHIIVARHVCVRCTMHDVGGVSGGNWHCEFHSVRRQEIKRSNGIVTHCKLQISWFSTFLFYSWRIPTHNVQCWLPLQWVCVRLLSVRCCCHCIQWETRRIYRARSKQTNKWRKRERLRTESGQRQHRNKIVSSKHTAY